MIAAGLKITFLGMSVVLFFLLLLILFMKISFWIFYERSKKELNEIDKAGLIKKRRSVSETKDHVLTAVLSAAINAHRSAARRVR